MTPNVAAAVLSLSQSTELLLLLKATVVIALGLLAARLAGHARASIRHVVLTATFGALLALPLATTTNFEIPIGVPVASIQRQAVSDLTTTAMPRAVSPATSADTTRSGTASAQPVSWSALLRGAWIAGTALFLAPLALILWRLGRLRRTGLPWPEMRDALRSLAADAGVNRPVDVALHEEVSSPLTFGTRNPLIVLPPDAPVWDEADLRRALVHELEHVRRCDWALQTAARAVAAVWWFHPLVWAAWRRLSLEAERACDDAVIVREEGMEYAEQLASLAERLSAARAQPTLGMAHRSDLSARVSSLLDRGQRRGRPGAGAVMAAICAAFVLVLAVAPLRAVATPDGAGLDATVAAEVEEQGRALRGLNRELYEAAEEADLDGIAELLQAGADVNASIAGDGSPLIAAVRSGQQTAVTFLLDRGANPDLGVGGDGSPLIVAAGSGRIDLVRLLLDRGADPDVGVRGDGTALIASAASGHTAVVTLLLDRGATVDMVVPGNENPLIQASEAGHLAVVQTLVTRGADVHARVWALNPSGGGEWRTPLGMARRGGHADVVAFLISAGARQ